MLLSFEYYFPPILSELWSVEDKRRYELLMECLSCGECVGGDVMSECVGGVGECVIEMDDSDVGRIMGRGGSIIRRIRRESGARIKVSERCVSGRRKIKIYGDEMDIKKAKERINECVKRVKK